MFADDREKTQYEIKVEEETERILRIMPANADQNVSRSSFSTHYNARSKSYSEQLNEREMRAKAAARMHISQRFPELLEEYNKLLFERVKAKRDARLPRNTT